MDDRKMLQLILDRIGAIQVGQNQLKKEINNKFGELESRLTDRIDKIGLNVAYLEDDSPTRNEFNKLEKRVKKVEIKIASVLGIPSQN